MILALVYTLGLQCTKLLQFLACIYIGYGMEVDEGLLGYTQAGSGDGALSVRVCSWYVRLGKLPTATCTLF